MEQAENGLEAGDDVSDVPTSVLLLHGKMLSLNILGTEIWKLCNGRTLGELAGMLCENFDVDQDVLKADLIAFLDSLEEHGFVHAK